MILVETHVELCRFPGILVTSLASSQWLLIACFCRLGITLLLQTLPVTCIGTSAKCKHATVGHVLRIETHWLDFPCAPPPQRLTDIKPLTSFLKPLCLPANMLFLLEASLLAHSLALLSKRKRCPQHVSRLE